MREDIFLAGIGGQGILLAGQLLLQAAMKAGLQGSGLPIYMPEVRGGETTITVVIADGPSGSPIIGRPHNLLLMDANSAANYVPRAAAGALVILNSSLVEAWPERDDVEVVLVPATDLAREAGSERAGNMAMVGAFLACKPLYSVEHFI